MLGQVQGNGSNFIEETMVGWQWEGPQLYSQPSTSNQAMVSISKWLVGLSSTKRFGFSPRASWLDKAGILPSRQALQSSSATWTHRTPKAVKNSTNICFIGEATSPTEFFPRDAHSPAWAFLGQLQFFSIASSICQRFSVFLRSSKTWSISS